jgi:GNAT superfamily N-acetyltransferase
VAGFVIRAARPDEVPALEALIEASARALSRGFYSDTEMEAAIAHVFGVDSDLISDGTYLVAQDGTAIVGCGGWSRRRVLFGGDRFAARESGFLDPAIDPARIRAFFVAPGRERRGIATALLEACEKGAAAAGFSRMALMATLPGVPFYSAHNYAGAEPIDHPCGSTHVQFLPMTKELLQN